MRATTANLHDFGASSLISWWRDAGVDTLIDETPRNWLAKITAAASGTSNAEAATPPAPVAAPMPTTLAEFTAWLMTDADVPVGGPPARRVAPAGPAAGGLMILADVPEAGDVEAGELLSGDAGALLDRMLGALGQDRASVYLATLAPSRPASGRLSAEEAERLIPAARRHVELARPSKLWLIGRAASRALLGMDEGVAGGKLHSINLETAKMEAIATVHPRVLLDEEKGGGRRMRKSVWADMQLLIKGSEA